MGPTSGLTMHMGLCRGHVGVGVMVLVWWYKSCSCTRSHLCSCLRTCEQRCEPLWCEHEPTRPSTTGVSGTCLGIILTTWGHDWFPPHYLSQSSPTHVYAFIPAPAGTQSRSVLSPLPRLIFSNPYSHLVSSTLSHAIFILVRPGRTIGLCLPAPTCASSPPSRRPFDGWTAP